MSSSLGLLLWIWWCCLLKGTEGWNEYRIRRTRRKNRTRSLATFGTGLLSLHRHAAFRPEGKQSRNNHFVVSLSAKAPRKRRNAKSGGDEETSSQDMPLETMPLDFLWKTTIPLLPNNSLPIIYPLALSASAFLLPFTTAVLLDLSFITFYYLGRALVVDDDEDTVDGAEPLWQPKDQSDLTAFAAAIASALLLSPAGLGTLGDSSGGGFIAFGISTMAFGFASVFSNLLADEESDFKGVSNDNDKRNRYDEDETRSSNLRMLEIFDERLRKSEKQTN